jgi:hypothetical protein
LRALVASAQQYHENRTALLQIDAIAGAVVNSKFADAVSNRRDVAGQAFRKA